MAIFPTDETRTINPANLDNKFELDKKENNRFFYFPTDNFNKNLGWISFTELTQELDSEGLVLSTPRKGNSVYLYMPKEGLTVADKADYTNVEFGIIGMGVENTPINEVNIEKAIDEGSKAIADTAMVLTGQTKNVNVIAKVLQQVKAIPQNVRGAASARIGRVANPHVRAVFNQVARRSFTYTFELIPNNAKENAVIKEIVNFFRANMYPETKNLENETEVLLEDFVYKFPNKFDIEYWFNKQRVGHRLKHCFLTDVKTSFNNQGSMSFYPDGGFISTKIELQFTEERTLSKKDIQSKELGIGF